MQRSKKSATLLEVWSDYHPIAVGDSAVTEWAVFNDFPATSPLHESTPTSPL